MKLKTEIMKIITHQEYRDALKLLYEYERQLKSRFEWVNDMNRKNGIRDKVHCSKSNFIREGYLPVGIQNIIQANYSKLGLSSQRDAKMEELSSVSLSELMECRGFGHKMALDLVSHCDRIGVELKP
jgi:hypothetical protein